MKTTEEKPFNVEIYCKLAGCGSTAHAFAASFSQISQQVPSHCIESFSFYKNRYYRQTCRTD